MQKHYHRLPGVQQKAQRSHSFVPMQRDIQLSESKGTDETTHIFWDGQAHAVRRHTRACAGTCKTCQHCHALQLKIDFHSWLFHFIGEMPGKISAACWLVKVTFEMTLGIVLTREAGSLAKKRVRVCTQKLMLAFPQHCIVSCKGGSTVFHGNWLLPIPHAFTDGKGSREWKWPKWAAK